MCGRYTLSRADKLAGMLREVEERWLLEARYNVAPQTSVPVVLDTDPGRLTSAKWGLVPFWSKVEKMQFNTINAKAETVATSACYREAFKRRHCLIPADGFYEWKKLSATTKQPYRFQRADGEIFFFGGLWEEWRDPGKGEDAPHLRTCTIITVPPNDVVAPVHNRMPLILRREDEPRWLAQDLSAEERKAMMAPYGDPMRAYKVSPRVGSVKNQDAGLIEEVA
jgi:putative SOS response-associated peptidase YedK